MKSSNALARRTGRRAGFTLVEMIVAAILLAVGVVAAMLCFGASTRATGIAGEYTTAAMLAESRLADIQTQTDQLTGGEQEGDFGDDHPGYRWRQDVETTDITNLYRITLTVEWPSGMSTRSAQFVTYQQVQSQTSTTGGAGAGP